MGMKEFQDRQQEKPQEEAQQQVSTAEARVRLQEMQAQLDRLERTTGSSGAVPSASKEMLLDARDVQKDHPNLRLRWVNVASDKAQMRRAQGYERVPLAEGGRQVGNLALFGLNREEYDRRVKAQEKMDKDRLSAHKTDVEATAEAVARILRDQHGLSVRAEDIIISE